ncbi:MAG TPA: GNAT family N-acetyltransferase [Candidatus Binataceae bacterium]|nr:GNAT family N-acetyltransferase [Candidatus Binataceae bacterium]
MPLKIETPDDQDGLAEFIAFANRVRPELSARWPAAAELHLPMLMGISAFMVDKPIRAFTAREGGEIVARVAAVLDPGYARRWGEKLGHLMFFEAAADAREATRAVMDAACAWLGGQGAIAARCGFYLPLENPFVIDEYDALPPNMMRQNPDYYHSMIKDAGFVCEKGLVDYKIEVTPELITRYQSALAAARRADFELTTLAEIPRERRAAEFGPAFNEAFYNHWGYVAASEAAMTELMLFIELTGGLETSICAYRRGEVVGTLMVSPEETAQAVLKPGRVLKDSEKLNFLGIGVREPARGRGLNLAMAAQAYLKLIERGAKYLSYTLVVDDNWPSRRTAEKLGAKVCANYVVYRRDFRQ